ncbi:RBPJ-interacting and tubulin-associated protein 1, partial [Ornithorhynchus anatinus]|uniref:RBPJ-interacting and tubulin-associated protein 1 n=1 Tax=Ornithorhynchus anatinus TaxID=9258 RepID=UPI0010A85284
GLIGGDGRTETIAINRVEVRECLGGGERCAKRSGELDATRAGGRPGGGVGPGRAERRGAARPGPTKTSSELAGGGVRALRPRREGRGGVGVRSRPSYVDETLFGGPRGARPPPPEFDPPWAERARAGKAAVRTPALDGAGRGSGAAPCRAGSPSCAPRRKDKYRLVAHAPSYCDETLFGPRPEGPGREAPRMTGGAAAKLRPLLRTPPSAPRPREPPRAGRPPRGNPRGRPGREGRGGGASGPPPLCPPPPAPLAHAGGNIRTPGPPP